jgi:hypothetical protein
MQNGRVPVAFFDDAVGGAEIEHDDANLAAVAGIDGAEVYRDGVLQGESTARAHLRFVTRRKFDGDDGGNGLREAGHQDGAFERAEIHGGVFVGPVRVAWENGVGVQFFDSNFHVSELCWHEWASVATMVN